MQNDPTNVIPFPGMPAEASDLAQFLQKDRATSRLMRLEPQAGGGTALPTPSHSVDLDALTERLLPEFLKQSDCVPHRR